MMKTGILPGLGVDILPFIQIVPCEEFRRRKIQSLVYIYIYIYFFYFIFCSEKCECTSSIIMNCYRLTIRLCEGETLMSSAYILKQ